MKSDEPSRTTDSVPPVATTQAGDADARDVSELLDELYLAVVVVDDTYEVRFLNAAAEALFGVSRARIVGSDLDQLVSLTQPLAARLEDSRKQQQPFSLRSVRIAPTRAERFLADLVVTPIDHAGEPALLLEVLALDRSRRIAIEEQNERQQRLSREMLRGLAHEVKNPLGGLRGAAQLLDVELRDSPLQEYTTVILREVDRLRDMVDRMLGPNQMPRRQTVNVHEVLEQVGALVALDLPEDIVLLRDYDPSIPDIHVDRGMLVQAVLNLVRNAVHALQGRGELRLVSRILRHHTIHSKRHRLVACLRVADNGPGVPEQLQERIFFPMVTGHADGTGLGLAIAQRLVQLNDGVIDFRSRPGCTEFDLLLPIHAASRSRA